MRETRTGENRRTEQNRREQKGRERGRRRRPEECNSNYIPPIKQCPNHRSNE